MLSCFDVDILSVMEEMRAGDELREEEKEKIV